MATVKGKTSIKIDELVNGSVISGAINPAGYLILTTRGGATINAGYVSKPIGEQWSALTSYKTGDVVGYAGQLWRCRSDHTNKPPGMFNSFWAEIIGRSYDGWPEKDPFFNGDELTEAWDITTKTGTAVATLTTAAGEFETGKQAMRIQMNASSSQTFYQKEENLTRGGDLFIVTIRAKLVSASTGANLQVRLLQNDDTGNPTPGASGLTTTGAVEGSQALTTSWATYTFNVTAVNAKPRAMLNYLASTVGASASVCVDWVRVSKSVAGAPGPAGPTGPVGPTGSIFYSGTGGPASGLGVVNDFYISVTNGDLYKKTGASTWTLQMNLVGPAGTPGAPGSALSAYPVGAVYISVLNTSPASLFGGTWVSFGQGRVLVGVDTGQTEFDTVEETGGSKTVALSAAEMPTHSHGVTAIELTATMAAESATATAWIENGGVSVAQGKTGGRAAHPVGVSSINMATAGGGAAHNNLQPYITTYMWKRTA